MRILQLCFFTNRWPLDNYIECIDLKNGSNVLDLPPDYGARFDLILASPPCDQFTKANSLNWIPYPAYYIKVANKTLDLCLKSGKPFVFENPPGRIEQFLPALSGYRIFTWHGGVTNKEYVVYSNMLFLRSYFPRYGKPGTINNYTKKRREMWQPDFYDYIISQFL